MTNEAKRSEESDLTPLLCVTDPDKNLLVVGVRTESGCSIKELEYSLYIEQIVNGAIGMDDWDLVEECMMEVEDQFPEEGYTLFVIEETGEREDVFWHKYYEVRGRLDA